VFERERICVCVFGCVIVGEREKGEGVQGGGVVCEFVCERETETKSVSCV